MNPSSHSLKLPEVFSQYLILFNTLTANYEYSRSNRESLLLPIETQLYEKVENFCQLSVAFLQSVLNFEHFENKN